MAAAPTVTVFNANYLAVQVSVNNGPQFAVAAAAGPAWAPQSPTSGGPTWSNTGRGQNVFAPGPNVLNIVPSGGTDPFVTTVNLPGNIQWNALQLYIFFNSYSDVSYIVLNAGQFVTGNLQLSSSLVTAHPHKGHEA